ncbi:MAG TPA: BatA domain-containing protein [Gemmataceae bacterium]|jgi:hypothetical protein|nr:BatA domain-containing protein [Gemmataceae bacterium]
MFDTFLNPGYVAAGAALVSLPIAIHLINRMRYRRVRWAAMEFLLKSQKRNRRRLIIEQLLLLLLRCFLVLMAALLASRYLGFSFAFLEPQNTLHVVVVDDTLSMSDHWRQDGRTQDTFREARDLISREIAKNAVQARTAQRVVVLTASEPATLRFDQRLNDQTLQDLQKSLDALNCTYVHVDLDQAVEAAKAIFDKNPQDRRFLHIISDFRERDWSEPDAASLARTLDTVTRAGVQVNLIDAAHPFRTDLQKNPLHHDNLAVVDLRPETRIAAKDTPVPFRVTLANFGATERKDVRVTVKVKGGERLEGSVTMTVPAGGTKTDSFQVSLGDLGFNLVSANLEDEEAGLQGDNTRYAVVEVRKQVPILIVDGDPGNGLKPGGDTYHLQAAFAAARGYQTSPRGVTELEQPNLSQYASIYIANVRDLSDKARRNLEAYVREGGSVAFFMGERVNAEAYNKSLWAGGKGLFPVPLADKFRPTSTEPEMEPNLFDGQLKLFVRDETNPVFADVWDPHVRTIFNFLPIKRYFPVNRRIWNPEPGQVEELVTLPNERSMRDYASQAQEIVDALDQSSNDPNMSKYRPALERHKRAIHDTLFGDKQLYELANALETCLKDKGDPTDSSKTGLAEFWGLSENQRLRARLIKFQETVRLGDPLVVSSQFGKGRVVVFLTTAGRAWNDWAGGSLASPTYPVILLELQKYLTASNSDAAYLVGAPVEVQLDSGRYDSKMKRSFITETHEGEGNQPNAPQQGEKSSGLIDLKEQLGVVNGSKVSFLFNEARKPGLYLFELERRGDDLAPGAPGRTEQRAFVFNVDPRESDLRRAPREELEHLGPAVHLRNPDSGWAAELANRQNDLSESPWFYLIFLLLLIAEQALAVRLSYHLHGKDETRSAPARSPVAAA